MSEHQRLLDQISLVAGQINRAKNEAAGIAPTQPAHGHSRRTFDSGPRPVHSQTAERDPLTSKLAYGYGRGRGGHYRGTAARGGYRIAKPTAHRHRTLILNGAPPGNFADDPSTASASSPSWVTKNDRHLQLINTSIYQEHTDARTKAIEQTRLQQLRQKENRERNRLMNHLTSSGYSSAVSTDPTSAPVYEILVEGIKFSVAKGGSKLVRLPGALDSWGIGNTCAKALAHSLTGDANAPKLTPKLATVGGVKFYRTKNGNMYRQAAVKAQRYVAHPGDGRLLTMASYRRSGAVHKVDIPCNKFSTTGSCPKGPTCRYIHDYAKVAACKNLLQKGSCVYGDQCNLSHDLTAERTPHCVHYAKGNCSKDGCPYTHRVLSPGAPVCRDFGLYGYCDKGISCPDRHSFECPDFSNTGVCNTKGCKLPHREYANVLRKAAVAREQALADDDDDGDDLSSDEGDSVGSDEVDSDEVDEFVGDDGSVGFGDQDFISL